MEDGGSDQQSINNAASEDTVLLGKKRSWFTLRYSSARKCVSSKSALLILLWSFVLGLWNGVALNPDLYLRNFTTIYTLAGYVFVAIVMLFFPLAGYLADVKYGRYKTVVRSLFIVLISIIPLLLVFSGSIATFYKYNNIVVPALVMAITYIPSYIGLAGFTANVIQFGMDQLHDFPGEERTLFIHWYVWLYFLSIFTGQLAWNLGIQIPYNDADIDYKNIIGFCMLGLIPLAILVVLPVTLCLARHRRRWFLIEPGGFNPYSLVYRVTKFARQHKTPVRRSAFTYCEDEVPTGLDLGKEKYGGPFTTEQVEDVKVFYGILKILVSFGTVFFLDFAASSVLPFYALHATPAHHDQDNTHYSGTQEEHILLNSGLLSPLLIVVCIPVYLCLLYPFISHCVPGMLKRMGLGILFTVFSLIASFSLDISAHLNQMNTLCMFKDIYDDDDYYNDGQLDQAVHQNSFLLIIPLTLSALSNMLIYTAVFEFICSQSPHSMKGLLIGLLYAIKGLYQLLATLLTVPIIAVQYSPNFPIIYPSCGYYYYLINIVLGVIALLMYMWTSERYRYRERDEPCNIRKYAEEYYSNPQEKQNCE